MHFKSIRHFSFMRAGDRLQVELTAQVHVSYLLII